MKDQTFFEKFNHWITTSVSIKLVSIGFLILLLLIPMSMIESLIDERESRRNEAIREVQDKWGRSQQFNGPILTVPYRSYYVGVDKEGNQKQYYETLQAHFLPEELKVTGGINPDERNRGIYDIIVYDADLKVSGKFNKPDFDKLNIHEENVLWDDAFLSIGISDPRGIKEKIETTWNKETYVFESGSNIGRTLPSGLHSEVPVSIEEGSYLFAFDVIMNGSNRISFVPLGKETSISLQSAWPDPSFDGAFIPDQRNVSEAGFEAVWKVLNLNRSYPQQWADSDIDFDNSDFGVELLLPVDQYQKSMRSTKYAMLFIGLTFLIFFFVEVKNNRRIHPIQYILVGLALCIFYTLLISLSEHIHFNLAYLVASIGVISIITGYCHSFLGSKLLTVSIFTFLSGLYSFMFVIIRSQDFALLIGSLFLFVLLALVMYFSKNINWYQNIDAKLETENSLNS